MRVSELVLNFNGKLTKLDIITITLQPLNDQEELIESLQFFIHGFIWNIDGAASQNYDLCTEIQ